MIVELTQVSARSAAARGQARAALGNVSLRLEPGVLAIVGGQADGATLLFDILDGTLAPASGRILIGGYPPTSDEARAKVVRVSLDAPLPERLRVADVCRLEAELRGGGGAADPTARLASLGVAGLASRTVMSLGWEERRTVALAIALGSAAEVLLLEEPLAGLDPVAPSLVREALRRRAETSTIVVATTSTRDATLLGDRLGVLSAGAYVPVAPGMAAPASVRVVLGTPAEGAPPGAVGSAAAALAAALSSDASVVHVETSASEERAVVIASGRDGRALSHAITRAVASSGVAVASLEPLSGALEAVRSALSARASEASAARPVRAPEDRAGAPR